MRHRGCWGGHTLGHTVFAGWHGEETETINQGTACVPLAGERTGGCAESLRVAPFPESLGIQPNAAITDHLGTDIQEHEEEQHYRKKSFTAMV